MAGRGLFGSKKGRPRKFVELERFWRDPNFYNAIIYGTPRSGKSVLLANMINHFMGQKFTILMNDVAKGYDVISSTPRSEILMFFSENLPNIKGVRIFVPKNCQIIIKDHEYELIQISSYNQLFKALKPDKLNIISIDNFILNPASRARFWALFFIEIINRSKRYQLNLPFLACLDQIHHLFPSHAQKHTGRTGMIQNDSATWFATFLQDSSGSGIKVIATSHGITMCRKSVRQNFNFKFFKNLSEDVGQAVPRIRPAQNLIATLPINSTYVVDDRGYGDVFANIPNVTYKPSSVFYQGDYINDPYWLLKSDRAELVETGADRYLITKINQERRGWQVAMLILLGYSDPAIARKLRISSKTVQRDKSRIEDNSIFRKAKQKFLD